MHLHTCVQSCNHVCSVCMWMCVCAQNVRCKHMCNYVAMGVYAYMCSDKHTHSIHTRSMSMQFSVGVWMYKYMCVFRCKLAYMQFCWYADVCIQLIRMQFCGCVDVYMIHTCVCSDVS